MGWFGDFIYDKSMSGIKSHIEKSFNFTSESGTKIKTLYQSFKFGASYLALEVDDPKEGKSVEAMVVLWRLAEKGTQLMTKNIHESSGPYHYDAPAKLLKMLTPTTREYAIKWRKECWKKFKNIPEEYKT